MNTSYRCFANEISPSTLEQAVLVMWHPTNREAMKCTYPLISDLLARISVLPATSADVERVFSTLKRKRLL